MTRQGRRIFLNPEVQFRLAGADPLHLCREAAERLGGRKKHQARKMAPGICLGPSACRYASASSAAAGSETTASSAVTAIRPYSP